MKFQSHSQAGQDLWVWEMLEHKADGFYVDIGCDHPSFHSNTRALEDLGWNGLLVDIVGGCEKRKGVFVKCDATSPSDRLRLHYASLASVVDYLSCDTDAATLDTLKALPFSRVAFRVMTIEHDSYLRGPQQRQEIRSMLQNLGYKIVCADVHFDWPQGERSPVEDFWAHPDLVSQDQISRFTCSGCYWKDIISR